MMFRLAVLACVLAVAAGQYSECGELQKLKVKAQWAESFGQTTNRAQMNREVWKMIIGNNPEIVDKYFQRVRGNNIYSPEFKAHTSRVMGGFDVTLSMMDDTDVFNAQLAHLKTQHIELSIENKYFDEFLSALMDAVQSRIGDCFDHDAWKVCGSLIQDGIKN